MRWNAERTLILTSIAAALALVTAGGCGSPNTGNPAPADTSDPAAASHEDSHGHGHANDHHTDGHEDGHAHSQVDAHVDHGHHDRAEHRDGPHGGQVIELGRNHEYHGELVEHEQSGTVIVFVLDADLNEMAIDQPSVVMDLSVAGRPTSFELTAVDQFDGRASRFEASSRDLFEALHQNEATGKLRVVIDGTPYLGDVEHHHHEAGLEHATNSKRHPH